MSQPICTYHEIDKRVLVKLIRSMGEDNAMQAMMRRWHREGCPIDRDDDRYTHRKGWERSSRDDGWGGVIFEWRIKEDDDD